MLSMSQSNAVHRLASNDLGGGRQTFSTFASLNYIVKHTPTLMSIINEQQRKYTLRVYLHTHILEI